VQVTTDSVISAPNIIDRFRLNGDVALVTGAAQGIGRGFAHALAEAGASVVVADQKLELASAVAKELEAKGAQSLALEVDVTSEASVESMVKAIVANFGKLDIGVNNVGIGQWLDGEEMPYADWLRMIDVNLNSVFLCCKAEARVMIPAGSGAIVNTASMSASISNTPQNQAHYNASKAGVLHLSRSLAGEWAPKGVRVNTISPGYTRTALVADLLETPIGKEMLPKWLVLTPMARMAEVTDLQGALIYLVSKASPFTTGSDLVIDGGYMVW
jgi:NAD(P)-dependent dehydrogenase (short-subunit alcohol dehydrogenase family)